MVREVTFFQEICVSTPPKKRKSCSADRAGFLTGLKFIDRDRAQRGTTNDNYDQMRCISRATLQSNRHILRARAQMTLRTRASCESLSVDVHMFLPAPSPALGCTPCLQRIKNAISYSSECVCCEQHRAQPVHPQTCHFQLGLVFVINAPSMVPSRELTLDHWSFQYR